MKGSREAAVIDNTREGNQPATGDRTDDPAITFIRRFRSEVLSPSTSFTTTKVEDGPSSSKQASRVERRSGRK